MNFTDNRLYNCVLGILLTIIGFFLIATYNKITDTNLMVYQLQVELAAIREHESQFMNYQDVSNLIDKKILQYHKEIILK